MKWFSYILLAACCSAPLQSQTSAPLTDGTSGNIAATKTHPLLKPAVRPPLSAIPSAQARVSTAQRMTALNNKPPLMALPGFTVTDRDGNSVTAATLSKSNHWILVYRKQNCMPCDRLMTVLAASGNANLKGGQPYAILVAGKNSEALERVRANYSTLGQAKWLADKDGHAFAALKPKGSPMVYAMDGSKIAWSVPGNLGNPTKVEKMASDWISSTSTSSSTQVAVPNQ